MKVSIKRMEFENFKGYRSKTFDFNGDTTISGANGLGKSTIMCGFLWVMCDVNEHLVSNPDVYPLGLEEGSPTVTIDMEVDGKPLKVMRKLKRSVKSGKDGSADSVSFTSTYEVNGIEHGLRDYKAKLEEYGFDVVKMLTLIHPDVFMSDKKDAMRKVLFSMASAKTDLEVAKLTEGADKVAEMLVNYSMDEIEGMQKSTIRKVGEEYGKKGEILKAKIEGMELTKVDVDLSALELEKNGCKEEIAKADAEIEELSKACDKAADIKAKQAEIMAYMNNLAKNANKDNDILRQNLTSNIEFEKLAISGIENNKNFYLTKVRDAETAFERCKVEFAEFKAELNALENAQFDEKTAFCPTCGQEYPNNKKAEIKANWENTKVERIEKLKARMNEINISGKAHKGDIKTNTDLMNKASEEIEAKKRIIAELQGKLEQMPDDVDIRDNAEYIKLNDDYCANTAALVEIDAKKARMSVLMANVDVANKRIREIDSQMAITKQNDIIDEKIAELRAKQSVYEQNLADAEKILYQLELVSKKKNELLTDEINSHFKLAKFKLFDYAKNGNYKEVCDCIVDDKKLGVSTNSALTLLLKLDVVSGLQNFFNQHLPVFIDNAELLDAKNRKLVDIGTQTIMLVVSNDKELVIGD